MATGVTGAQSAGIGLDGQKADGQITVGQTAEGRKADGPATVAAPTLAPNGPPERAALGRTSTAGIALATVCALLLAVRLPVATTVFGLAIFGILHNVTELRYVLGRFGAVLNGPFLRLLAVLISGIVLCRLMPAGQLPRVTEILLTYGVLAAACLHGLRRRPAVCAAAVVVVSGAAAASLRFPDYHFVVLTHLHNVVPLLFLWEWSRELERGRRLFRAVQCGWVLLVPALLLGGAFDRWLAPGGGRADTLAESYTPSAWLDSPTALRFLTLFAFLQTMHYVVWVWFLPRHATAATAAFEKRAPLLRGRRLWGIGLLGGALLAVLFTADYAAGKQLYAAVASYHAYLEFPVLLVLVLGIGGASAAVNGADPTDAEANSGAAHTFSVRPEGGPSALPAPEGGAPVAVPRPGGPAAARSTLEENR